MSGLSDWPSRMSNTRSEMFCERRVPRKHALLYSCWKQGRMSSGVQGNIWLQMVHVSRLQVSRIDLHFVLRLSRLRRVLRYLCQWRKAVRRRDFDNCLDNNNNCCYYIYDNFQYKR
jgi:hypothetical protein